MNRIFSTSESMFVGIYYAAIFLTPANVRNAVRVIGACRSRISDFAFSMRAVTPRLALILGAVMVASAASAGGLGQAATASGQAATASDTTPVAATAALPQDVIDLRREGNE